MALALAAGSAHAGGGWVPARGASYVELSLLHGRTDERYDADGMRAPFRRQVDVARPTTYTADRVVVYAEAGLGRGFALEGDVALERVRVDEPATRFRTAGPCDLRLRLKRGFRAGPVAWALSLEGKAPLSGAADDYPALGSGEFDAAAQAHAGIAGAAGWAQVEAGLRRRGGPARDEWPFAAQVGVHARPAWTALLDLRGNGLLGAGGAASPAPEFDPATASASVLQGGPGVAWLPGRGLRLSAQAWRTLAGRNLPAGWTWKLAVARLR